MSRQTKIAALQRLAAPDSGATDNERKVALDKLARLEGSRQEPLWRIDPNAQYVVGWDVATGPDQHVNCRCTMEAWPEAEAHFQEAFRKAQEAMQRMVYAAVTTGGSINDMADAIRRGMDNVHDG